MSQEFKEHYKATVGADLHVKEITIGDDKVRLQVILNFYFIIILFSLLTYRISFGTQLDRKDSGQ